MTGGAARIDADVCVVGAGAAGLVLAQRLAAHGREVVVLERGGRRVDRRAHRENLVEDTGHPVGPIHRRRRFAVGGAGRVWAGVSLELEELDLRPVATGIQAAWPFGMDELGSFYRRARELLDVPTIEEPRLRSDRIATIPLDRSDVRFGVDDTPIRGVTVRTGSIVTRLRFRRGESGPVDVHGVTREGEAFSVHATAVVLAAGGIEAPRLLLASGVGARHDRVGRFFADHPYLTLPVELPSGGSPPDELIWDGDRFPPRRLAVRSPGVRAGERVLGAALFFRPHRDPAIWNAPGVQAWSEIAWSLRSGDRPSGYGRLAARVAGGFPAIARAGLDRRRVPRRWAARVVVEPVPDPDSRVSLSDRRDPLSEPVPRVDWKLGDASGAALESFLSDMSAMAASEGWGPIGFPAGIGWPEGVEAGAHHMGATRMHPDPAEGVVDEHLLVHGTTNLYVVGPSVFPTYGYANPMLTNVALALRLVDHLVEGTT